MGGTGSFRFPQSIKAARSGRQNGLEIRPLSASDKPELKRFFVGVSEESIHRRFMHVRRGMREEQLRKLLETGISDDLTLVAVLNGASGEEIAGIGQYFRARNGQSAEFALLVRDDLQGKGIGTALLSALRTEARAHGIEVLTASVMCDNAAMLHVAGKAGFKNQGAMHDSLLSLRSSLSRGPKGTAPGGRK